MPPAGVVLLYISHHDAARIVSGASLIDALTLATALTSATSSSESLLGRGSAVRPPRRSQPSLGGASLAPWNARDRALPACPLPPPT